MSNAIEIEAKALVQAEDYKKLTKAFRGSPRYVQTNHYIDTEDRSLAKEGLAIRIREKGQSYELTLKTPLSEGLLEKNAPITYDQFVEFRDFGDFPKTDITRFLLQLDVDITKLKILTSLTTERVDVEYEGGLLSLDRNTYSGKTDYEIEFEYNSMNGAQKIMKDLFDQHEIPCHFSTASKVQRAMAAIGK
ncbi:MAG: CYTH domain-containing protein [Candidatus Enteromonas sp.]